MIDQGISLFPARGHLLLAKLGKAKPVPYQKPKIHITKMPKTLNADPAEVDCSPRMRILRLTEQSSLRPRFARKDAANFIPTNPLLSVEARQLADRGHNPLAGATGRADRLYQRPTVVVYPTLPFCVAAQKHTDSILHASIRNQGVVPTTSDFQRTGADILKLFGKQQQNFALYEQPSAENGLGLGDSVP
jgi:hypothetical protein